jgi:kynurenine formamidase
MASKWYPSKWGAEDEVGALRNVTEAKVRSSSRMVEKGKIYALDHVLEYGVPVFKFHGDFIYSTFRRHTESLEFFRSKNKFGAMNARLQITDHTGTHIDALNHISKGDRLYNGHKADKVIGTFGTSKLGIETTPPIFTRGVLLDIASYEGKDVLEPNHSISAADIKGALRKDKLKIEKGDAVLIATGWAALWMVDNDKFSKTCPGINLDAGRWLAAQDVSIVGADTWNVEVTPAEKQDEFGPVHQHLLTENGIRLIENMDLEELRKDKVREFLFVCLPLRVKGGTGSPIMPIAVV